MWFKIDGMANILLYFLNFMNECDLKMKNI